MLIFLSGENSYERSRYASALLEEFLKKHGSLGVRKFDFYEDTVPDFIEFIRSRSMFNPIKLAFLGNISISFPQKSEEESFQKAVESVKEDEETVVLISTEKIPELFEPLAAGSSINKKFPLYDEAELRGFLKKEGKRRGLLLSDADCDNLTYGYGRDLQSLINEIDRLSLSGESLDKDNYAGTDLFALVNNIRFGRNKAQKLLALELILSKLGVDSSHAFNLMTSFAPKTMSPEDWFKLLSDYDILVKSGKIGYEEALLDLALL